MADLVPNKVAAYTLHVDLIYAATKEADYLMPLSVGTDGLGLETKKAYSAKEVLLKIAEANNQSTPETSGKLTFGGSTEANIDQSANKNRNAILVTATIGIIVIGIAGWMLARRKLYTMNA